MRSCTLILLLFTCLTAYAQPYSISGRVEDEYQVPLDSAIISISQKGMLKLAGKSNKEGLFSAGGANPGKYLLTIVSAGYAAYGKEVTIKDSSVHLGIIRLASLSQTLDEVKIVKQALAVAQKDDTMEYSSSAYKVNPDADAADLVRKMPGIELNGKEVKAQGEKVLKVLVDGKPFFGEDAWATLKNLPADVIDKVQVYNEKSDQERFTGFSEGPQGKAINIVTKPGRRNGVFGNAFGGGGADNSGQVIYGSGFTVNRFAGDRRISVTTQANNVNIQNFTEQGTAGNTGGSGITTTHAAGINYNDKWGKKTDVSGNYFYNNTANSLYRDTRRTYVLPSAAGQEYNEQSPSVTDNTNHRAAMRVSYAPDSMNTLLWQPGITINKGEGYTARSGTTAMGAQPLNQTSNNNNNLRTAFSLSNNVLYTRRFARKGRTFSAGVTVGYNTSNTETIQQARNINYTDTLLNDTLDQQVLQEQQAGSLTGNATWTEPVSKSGLLKLQYNGSWQPSASDKNAYDYLAGSYSVPDSQLSNAFRSNNATHKAGGSYLHKGAKYEFSVGLNYQLAMLASEQQLPSSFALHRTFGNLLPVATYQYRFSKTRNLQCNYATSTHAPSITQLQNVVNNADPLHLSTGNPALRQPYSHNLSVRYNASGVTSQSNVSASLTGAYTQRYITSASLVAVVDTMYGATTIPAGAQLTLPVNIDGNTSLSANVSYSKPIKAIKCRINLNLSAGINRTPSIINGITNYQQNRNTGIGLSVNSNISEQIDFSLSSNTSVTANDNPVNRQFNSTFVNEALRGSVNLLLWKGIVINSSVTYQANLGLSAGYNRNFVLWNLALGKKVFGKRQGDIRLSVFDMLNENNNVQRSISEAYIQDTRTNILQRYYMLVFTYKISRFGK